MGWKRDGTRVRAVGHELGLLVLVVAVTAEATWYGSLTWAPLDTTTGPGPALLVAGVAMLLVLPRRRLPVLSLLAAATLFGWYPGTAVAVVLASFEAADRVRGTRRRLALLCVAALIPCFIGLVASHLQWLATALTYGVSMVVCVVVPVMARLLLDQRDRLLAALRDRAALAGSAARATERARIAGEVHDLVGHRLSLISLYAGALELDAQASHSPRVQQEAVMVRRTVFTALEELRSTLGMLHTGTTATTAGLARDIADLVEQSRGAGVPVDLSWHGTDLLDAALPVRQALHRIVREGLANVHRHAPGARASVWVDRTDTRVRVAVRNPCVSTRRAPSGTGQGLIGVRERVRLLAGTFSAGIRPDGDFEMHAELPLVSPEPSAQQPDPVADTNKAATTRLRLAAVLAAGLVGAVAVVSIGFTVVDFADPAADTPLADFDRITLGTPQSTIDHQFGPQQPVAKLAGRSAEPPRPLGTVCEYWFSDPHHGPLVLFERLCFRDRVLVDKTQYATRT